jgi:hypothetical protein
MSDEPAVDAETLRQLYTAPPAEFVAARTAAVKERRAAGDRAGATAVAALRKASAVDVALNLVAVEQPEVVESFLAAAGEVRDAQTAAAEGRRAGSTRDALRELRAETAALVASAAKAATGAGLSGSLTAPATARLGELVANEAAGAQLRAGHLGSGAVESADPFAGLSPGTTTVPASRARRAAKRPAAEAPAPPSAKDEAKRRRLEAAVARAEEQRASAQEDLDGADGEVATAHDDLAAAEKRRRQCQEQLDRAEAARAKAAVRLDTATAALVAARTALVD